MPELGGGEWLATLMFVERHHPDAALRQRLAAAIDAWIESLDPRFDVTQVDGLLTRVSGTPLEPFVLGKVERVTAIRLIRAAFSRKLAQKRVRIVSQDTLGDRGGLIVTAKLSAYYVERFALAKHRITPRRMWAFVPGQEPQPETVRARIYPAVDCRVLSRSEGMVVQIAAKRYSELGWPASSLGATAASLATGSTIGPRGEPLRRVGIVIEEKEGALFLVPKTPEAVIRFSAFLADQARVELRPSSAAPAALTLVIRLALPEGGELALDYATTRHGGVLEDWIRVETDQGPALAEPDVDLVSQWLGPHKRWMEQA